MDCAPPITTRNLAGLGGGQQTSLHPPNVTEAQSHSGSEGRANLSYRSDPMSLLRPWQPRTQQSWMERVVLRSPDP